MHIRKQQVPQTGVHIPNRVMCILRHEPFSTVLRSHSRVPILYYLSQRTTCTHVDKSIVELETKS